MHGIEHLSVPVSTALAQKRSRKSSQEYTLADETYTHLLAGSQLIGNCKSAVKTALVKTVSCSFDYFSTWNWQNTCLLKQFDNKKSLWKFRKSYRPSIFLSLSVLGIGCSDDLDVTRIHYTSNFLNTYKISACFRSTLETKHKKCWLTAQH